MLSDASSALAEGELMQRADAWNPATTRERYLARCDLKTARLFQAACELGALEGGGPHELLGRFGRRIGLAFQLLDDVLDVSGPAERTGKHRGTDLLDGTVTLPLILARERDAELAALDLRGVRTPEQAEAVCDAIAATGVLDAARADALAMVAEAKAELPELPASQRGALELVADGVVDRYSLEVHRPDGVRGERAAEALDLVLHVGLGEAHEVLDEALGAPVELLVEAVDDRLVEDAQVRPLAVRAAEQHLPLRRGGLLPLHRVDQLAVAVGADVQVASSGWSERSGLGGRGLGVEVDDLDLAARGEDHAADVMGVVGRGIHES